MSLNGLDDDVVVQAYQIALVEAGGWFLLKYANRDTVCVLDHGNGGVSEVRSAVGKYDEKSPLYGLVQYRRKKIILKYVPEGTSRLLQVRLAVQFQSILDTFTPHDTVFSFTTAEELSESTLGLSTMKLQHNASVTSSSSSLRQRRLNEITETAEESIAATSMAVPPRKGSKISLEKHSTERIASSPASVLRAKELLNKSRAGDMSERLGTGTNAHPIEHLVDAYRTSHGQDTHEDPVSPVTDNRASSSHSVLPKTSGTLQSIAGDSITRPSLDFSIPETSMDSDDEARRPMPKDFPRVAHSTHLSAAESSDISKWTDDVLASTKQKRAPRPHMEAYGRPRTAGTNESTNSVRPVANLPTSIRVSNRVPGEPSRPGSRQSARSVPSKFMSSATSHPPLPAPIPAFPQVPSHRTQGRPPTAHVPTNTDGSEVTPEKLRLMKALQMRKRNQLLAQRSTSTAPSIPDQSGSIENLDYHAFESNASKSLSTSSISTNAEMLHQVQDLASIDESETNSPTSVVTTSDQQSTKPSSLSTDSMRKRSQTSLSSGTNSSTTPKADSDNKSQPPATIEGSVIPIDEHILVSVASISETVQSPVEMLQDHTGIATSLESAKDSRIAKREDESLKGPETRDVLEDGLLPQLKSRKRHVFEGSIQIPTSTEASDISDDESFLDELQNATVHEAKPISVNRTPVTPVVAKTPTREFLGSSMKITTPNSMSNESQVSTPDKRRTASRAGSTRSVSTALPQWPPPQMEPVPAVPKQKPTLGSNISKRIKALEGLSQRDSISNTGNPKDSNIRPGLTTLLKRSSFLTQLSSTPISPEKPPLPRAVSSPLFAEPEAAAENPIVRPLVQRPGTSTEVYTPLHKGETVSVTARIIRDPVKPKSAHGTSDAIKSMHRSPLIVEHEAFDAKTMRPSLPRGLTTMSTDSVLSNSNSERRRFSFSSPRSTVRRLSSTESKTHSLSFSSPRKRSSKSASETSSVAEDKRSSRTNRMLKRLSGFGKPRSSKERLASPPRDVSIPQPNTIQEQTELDPDSTRHVVDIGEVNVQFPEILLWKRRFLRVDDQGYLIFAPPSNDHSTRGKSRKIHLDEFTRPYLPEIEHEEMAWSIILGLTDGRCVQCACESRDAQKATLKLLTDAHRAYHQLYHHNEP